MQTWVDLTEKAQMLQHIMKYEIGDRVMLAKTPGWAKSLPEESQLAFKICLHKIYPITEITPEGLLVLDVSADVDAVLGSEFNDIRVEPKYVLRGWLPE